MSLGAALNVNVQADVWTVLTAVGTVGSVIVAGIASWYAVTSAKRERRRIENERRDREPQTALREARKVTVMSLIGGNGAPGNAKLVRMLRVINGSNDPIFEVEVDHLTLTFPTVRGAPVAYFKPNAPNTYVPVLLGGQSHDIPVAGT
ncbi:MAG: hypothetical protein QOE71_2753 [Pseudonocardiales bacterium]|nr:hypothetical protein [Pseudonocardiales bacterium]